jgi:hypothetical protein
MALHKGKSHRWLSEVEWGYVIINFIGIIVS